MDRVLLVNAALRRAQEGKHGGLYIYKDLVCNKDPNPAVDRSRNSLIKEMQNLLFAATGDKPEKEHDDAADALGYYYVWRSRKTTATSHAAITRTEKAAIIEVRKCLEDVRIGDVVNRAFRLYPQPENIAITKYARRMRL